MWSKRCLLCVPLLLLLIGSLVLAEPPQNDGIVVDLKQFDAMNKMERERWLESDAVTARIAFERAVISRFERATTMRETAELAMLMGTFRMVRAADVLVENVGIGFVPDHLNSRESYWPTYPAVHALAEMGSLANLAVLRGIKTFDDEARVALLLRVLECQGDSVAVAIIQEAIELEMRFQ